jgi:hypothetical protein
MNRRKFVISAAATGSAAGAALPEPHRNAIYELRYYRLRNGVGAERTQSFLSKGYLPAAERAGIGPLGFFTGVIAADSPFVLCLASYPSLAGMETSLARLVSDKQFQAAAEEYDASPEPNYTRMESFLLRAFDSAPRVEVPSSAGRKASRIFELRTYESNSVRASKRKIRMFDDAEIAIFRRNGLLPVFFGETLAGRNQPSLTYMVAFDDLAARDQAWRAFGADPEWQKLRVTPGLTDPEIVSNISNAILRPLPFSPIR